MTRSPADRLGDITTAIDTIGDHLSRGGLDDGLVFDAVRMRLQEIGEAVNALDPALLATEPDISWRDVVGMRNVLAHQYFDTLYSIVVQTVETDLPVLRAAVERLRSRV